MCDSMVMMDWVRDRIRDAMTGMREELQNTYSEIVPASEIGSLRAEVEMLRGELQTYRSAIVEPIVVELTPSPESASDLVDDVLAIAEAAASVAEAAAETVEPEPEPVEEMVPAESMPTDSEPQRKSWYERKLFGG